MYAFDDRKKIHMKQTINVRELYSIYSFIFKEFYVFVDLYI